MGEKMNLPEEMQEGFSITLRGYNTEEVDAFIDDLCAQMDALSLENTSLADRLARVSRECDTLRAAADRSEEEREETIRALDDAIAARRAEYNALIEKTKEFKQTLFGVYGDHIRELAALGNDAEPMMIPAETYRARPVRSVGKKPAPKPIITEKPKLIVTETPKPIITEAPKSEPKPEPKPEAEPDPEPAQMVLSDLFGDEPVPSAHAAPAPVAKPEAKTENIPQPAPASAKPAPAVEKTETPALTSASDGDTKVLPKLDEATLRQLLQRKMDKPSATGTAKVTPAEEEPSVREVAFPSTESASDTPFATGLHVEREPAGSSDDRAYADFCDRLEKAGVKPDTTAFKQKKYI